MFNPGILDETVKLRELSNKKRGEIIKLLISGGVERQRRDESDGELRGRDGD